MVPDQTLLTAPQWRVCLTCLNEQLRIEFQVGSVERPLCWSGNDEGGLRWTITGRHRQPVDLPPVELVQVPRLGLRLVLVVLSHLLRGLRLRPANHHHPPPPKPGPPSACWPSPPCPPPPTPPSSTHPATMSRLPTSRMSTHCCATCFMWPRRSCRGTLATNTQRPSFERASVFCPSQHQNACRRSVGSGR